MVGLVAVFAVVLLTDLVAGLVAGLAADLADVFAAGLPVDLVASFVDLAVALEAGLRVGCKASEPIGPTGTVSRRVGVRPALTVAFFLATGLRTGSAGLGAPNFKRTGLSPQISSRL